jgi:hypothetical protein
MKQFIFKPMVLLVVVLTAVAGSGCTGSRSEPSILTKVTLPPPLAEYELTKVIKLPGSDSYTQDERGYWLEYELPNGAWFRLHVRQDPVTGEVTQDVIWGDIATLQKLSPRH